MPRDDKDKIVSLDQHRERDADRKRAETQARAAAAHRKRLAERGPTPVYAGRMVGRVLGLVIIAAGLAALGFWVWSLIPH